MHNPIITLQNVCFSPDGKRNIIDNLSLTINHGDFIVLLGGNGSGKSSLLKLINHTYKATSGEVILDHKPIHTYSQKTLRKKLITLTQFTNDSLFLELTLEENALLIENALHDDIVDKNIFLKSLPTYFSSFHPTLAQALKTPMKRLSGGEQQIAAFALYLRHQPDILLLDEHTSALDPKKSDHVMAFTAQLIKEKNITCLMITHSLHHAISYGNRLIAIREGQCVFDANTENKAALSFNDLLTYCY